MGMGSNVRAELNPFLIHIHLYFALNLYNSDQRVYLTNLTQNSKVLCSLTIYF